MELSLTKAEEKAMKILWSINRGLIRDVVNKYDDPKPAYTTVATIFKILEKKGFVGRTPVANSHEYYPLVERDEYTSQSVKSLVENYFSNSFKNMVSEFSNKENMTTRDMQELIAYFEKQIKEKKEKMMEAYLLKSGISLIVLYGLYKIMLRYEFNHQLNRFTGLACVLFSITFPFVQFNQPQTAQLPGAVYTITTATAGFQEDVSSVISKSKPDIILLGYMFGASLLLLRVLVGLVTLARYYFSSPKHRQWGFTVVTVDKGISPFTFFNILFVGNNHMGNSEMDAMLMHERVHRDQLHSVDAVLLEVLTVVFWFNPVMWFFQKDIKAEHEYIADGQVLKTGTDRLAYQFILFKARTGTSMELGSYLSNKTSLAKRFNMMAKANSNSKGSCARALVFVLLMAVILFIGACSNMETQPDKNATYKEGDEALHKTIMRQLKYPQSARNEHRTGLVWVSFTVSENGDVENVEAFEDKRGFLLKEITVTGYAKQPSEEKREVDDVLRAEGIRVVKTLGKFNPAQKDDKPVSSVVTIAIKFLLE